MLSLSDELSLKAKLSSFRPFILQHTVILLLLAGSGQTHGAQPPQRIMTLVGEDVVLPCRLEPPLDAVSKSVEWGRPDLEPRFVHVWHEGQDHLVNQNPSYRGRTSVSIDKLRQGDLSLLLSAVKLSDHGLYRCYFPSQDKTFYVELVVGSSRPLKSSDNAEEQGPAHGAQPSLRNETSGGKDKGSSRPLKSSENAEEQGQTQGAQPPLRMVTLVGEDVVLPCRLEPPLDAVSKSVEWARPDLEPRFVHVWHEGQDHLVNQNPSYRGRTSVSIDKLKQGDLSLLLSAVKLSDHGLYRCYFPQKSKESTVELVVGSVSTPVISKTKYNSSFIDSQCESTGWYPEPEVFWLDGEGNLLSAGPTETVRGPDDLYTVSSRVTVEKRHSNSFTCRVQQNHTNQIRQTNVQISADCFEFTSCSAHVAVLVVFVLLFIVAAVCVVWKWRQIQTKERKKQQEDQSEREQLISERTEDLEKEMAKLKEELKEKDEMLKKKDETLQKNERALKRNEDFEQEVYSKLTEQSEELEKQREKLRQQQRDMERNITVIEKEMQSVEKMAEGDRFHKMKEITLTAKTQLNKRKLEDADLHIQTRKMLNKATELLKKITYRKKEEAQEESQ